MAAYTDCTLHWHLLYGAQWVCICAVYGKHSTYYFSICFHIVTAWYWDRGSKKRIFLIGLRTKQNSQEKKPNEIDLFIRLASKFNLKRRIIFLWSHKNYRIRKCHIRQIPSSLLHSTYCSKRTMSPKYLAELQTRDFCLINRNESPV